MWEVIVGGIIAIAGGFVSNIFINYINNKNKKREKKYEAYEEIAKCLLEIDKEITKFDIQHGTMTMDLFLIKAELYTSKELRLLIKEYNKIINRIFQRELPLDGVIKEKDELKQRILYYMRKSINRKNGGQA